ncbi:MAG TPA: hypothetical protein VMW66_05935 [Elusimicrobiales bacterium]|nr:hypothetical protein [Elusimicrobiales bacterium]
MKQLAEDLRAIIAKYPQIKSEVQDFYQLCRDEIEEGGSEMHEIELCRGSVQELVDEIEKGK